MNEANSRMTIDNSLANLAKSISEAHGVLDVLEERLANVLSPQTAGQNSIEKTSVSPTRFALAIDGQRERVSSLTKHLHEIMNRLDLEVPPPRPTMTGSQALR